MTNKFWIDICMAVVAILAAVGVVKTKKPGWGPRSIQALVIAIGVPAVVILGLEGILNSQAVAAILGGIVGFGAGTASRGDAA